MLSILYIAIVAFLPFAFADKAPLDPPAAYFIYTHDAQHVAFALNIDRSTGDLYMHMSAPAINSWVGVGIGSQMKGALTFIAYPSSNGTGVTLSPRVASGNSEPSHYGAVTCDLIYHADLNDSNTVTAGSDDSSDGNESMIIVNAVCHGATKWNQGGVGGALNIDTSGGEVPTSQDFIFAVGPPTRGRLGGHRTGYWLYSDSLSAGLRRHAGYGHFTMDLSKAISNDLSTAGVPRPNVDGESGANWKNYVEDKATSTMGQVKSDSDRVSHSHGFAMCFAFVIVLQIGAVILRVLNRVILHAVVQGFGLFLVICGAAGGIVISKQYNRSKNFASAHQVIGILLFLALITQLGLGIIHHRLFKKQQRPTIMGKIHLYLGPIAMLLGLINAPLGLILAGDGHLCLSYAMLVLLMIIIMLAIRFSSRMYCKGMWNKQASGGAAGCQQPHFVPGPYAQPPPGYQRYSSYGGSEDVELQRYPSQHSAINAPAASPRPMV